MSSRTFLSKMKQKKEKKEEENKKKEEGEEVGGVDEKTTKVSEISI